MALKVESRDPLSGRSEWSGALADIPADGGTAGSRFYRTDASGAVPVYIWDGAQWTWWGRDGQFYDPDGNVLTLGASGTQQSALLTVPVAAATVTGASFVWTSETGCKAFTASSLREMATDEPIAVAWDTSESAEAAIQATLAALVTEHALADASLTGLSGGLSNVTILTFNDPVKQVFYDGSTTIKTIGACEISGSTVHTLLLETIV